MAEPLLRVENLKVEFSTEDGIVHAVDGITYQVMPGRTLGIVGESGSGKTVASLTTLGLTRGRSTRISGRILFGGRDLATLPDSELRTIRGNDIAVMYAGRIVETASADLAFSGPEHPYTWGLLRSIPALDRPRDQDLVPIPGTPPSLIRRPSGCHFHPRCLYAQPDHARIDPQLEPVSPGSTHYVACLLSSEDRRRLWAELQAGRRPREAIAQVGLPETPA